MGTGHFALDPSCQSMSVAGGNNGYDSMPHHHYSTPPQFNNPMNLSNGISMHYPHYGHGQQTAPPTASDFPTPSSYMHPGYYHSTGVGVGSSVSAYAQAPYYYPHLGSTDGHGHGHGNSYADYDTTFPPQPTLHNAAYAGSTGDSYGTSVGGRTGYGLHLSRHPAAAQHSHGKRF